ncbi:D-alanyl-D-alanine carboxypeptidase/D-alanyl-D-alanine-endopeptidase [Aliiroseovarius subalbicans]|uniref:D-alanyl-D-alanine carboxypeptidase/D-alanyl-D-alanine endopeptidase n=1 Tax=Aliiroseovarius subalbicans TaxID=2925840 RepID=UPI001F57F842|nr:D-alanyl-D-alanine carboxypeptidase/D-alanyl-D-alanine-endopeptidase [Aliiroseovarius subalbicans]MCI2397846.1 D-alanyl-D-alanine carboxypeptidase/D-alanyl-D-alanine-endopeptidase [Aliiroseovarius subalbicans]
MTYEISRRVLLGGLGAALASPALAEAPLTSPFPQRRAADFAKRAVAGAEGLIAQAQLGGKVGFVVANARTGQVLETHNPLLPLPPASVAKAMTAVYGLSALGTTHRFATRLVATGPVQGGVIQGDLVLTGGGDPVLDTDALAAMAGQLKALGVVGVTGKFQVHDGALPYQRVIDDDQPDHLGYNPSVSGLNLNYNRVHFEWKRANTGYTVAMDARSEKHRPEVAMAQMRVVARTTPVYTYSAGKGGVDEWTVAQGALGNGGSRWLPVRNPALYAGEVFQALARAHGVRLPKVRESRKTPTGSVLVSHDSPDLATITRGMLKYSTNLTAEVIGLSASQERGAKPGSLRASASAMSKWAKADLGAKHAKFLDHSGLNDGSRVSASDMAKALVKVGPDGALHNLMKEIRPLDAQGKPFANPRHAIRAKTGTLNFVSSLAGYVDAPDGSKLAFAIFTGDVERRNRIKRSDRERPEGASGWARRSRWLQQQLISRWAVLYGS